MRTGHRIPVWRKGQNLELLHPSLQDRLRTALAHGPMWPDDLYAMLWPGRRPRCERGAAQGGPSGRAFAVHCLLGRKPYRHIAERLMEPYGKYGRYQLIRPGGGPRK
jgi:hypothetical protein